MSDDVKKTAINTFETSTDPNNFNFDEAMKEY